MNSLKNLKILVFVLVVVLFFGVSGCQTFYGAVADVETGAGWLRRNLKPVNESMEQARVRNAARLVLEQQEREEQRSSDPRVVHEDRTDSQLQ